MISNYDTSYYMNLIVNLARRNLLKYGYAYPLLTTMSQSKAHGPPYEDEMIRNHEYFIIKDMQIVDDEYLISDTKDLIYLHIYQIRFSKVSDEEKVERLIKRMAREVNPEAIGYVSCCVYNEYDDADKVTKEKLLMDPDVARVIHATYYRRGNRTRKENITVYINRGKLPDKKEPVFCLDPAPDEHNIDINYEILFADSGWFYIPEHYIRKLNYPYEK